MFFIFGSPRSGTTLLAQCLNAHDEIVVPHETDFIVPLAFIYDRVPDAETGRKMMAELATKSAYSNSLIEFLPATEIRDLILSSEYHPGKIISAIYEAIGRVMKKRMAGDKSPNDLAHLPILIKTGALASSKMIHIVRDVRDVMASLYQTKWVDPANVQLSRLWSGHNLHLHHLFQHKPDQYLLIRYEEMVSEPAVVFRKICKFLGVGFQKEMLSSEKRDARYRKMDHHKNLFTPISQERIGSYLRSMTPEQIAACELNAREGLETFGYSISAKASVPVKTGFKKNLRKLFR